MFSLLYYIYRIDKSSFQLNLKSFLYTQNFEIEKYRIRNESQHHIYR